MKGIEEQNNREALKAELKFLLKEAYDRNKGSKLDSFHEKIIEKSNELKQKYPDYIRYQLYHLFIFSTPNDTATEFDFPGEDSIETFIRSL